MLHMEILRSPVAHARIVSIDVSKAWDIPGVRLVLTGEMMVARNLAWMPTLSYDTQAGLATAKGRVRGDRRRVRAVAGDREPHAGAGRGRTRDPRRQGEPARQRRLHLGGRRQ